jgi:hypothetical protein
VIGLLCIVIDVNWFARRASLRWKIISVHGKKHRQYKALFSDLKQQMIPIGWFSLVHGHKHAIFRRVRDEHGRTVVNRWWWKHQIDCYDDACKLIFIMNVYVKLVLPCADKQPIFDTQLETISAMKSETNSLNIIYHQMKSSSSKRKNWGAKKQNLQDTSI